MANYNENLQENNTELQAILTAVNNLPELTTETWTFELEDGSFVTKAVYVGG